MSKATLSFIPGLGSWEDGAGSSRVVGIADTGQGISTAMAVMPTTTNRFIESRLGNLSSEVDMMGSKCRWNIGRGWQELGKPKLMNRWQRKVQKNRTHEYAQRPSGRGIGGCLLHRNGQRVTSMDPGRESCAQWKEETAARRQLKNRDN